MYLLKLESDFKCRRSQDGIVVAVRVQIAQALLGLDEAAVVGVGERVHLRSHEQRVGDVVFHTAGQRSANVERLSH